MVGVIGLSAEERASISKVKQWIAAGGGQLPCFTQYEYTHADISPTNEYTNISPATRLSTPSLSDTQERFPSYPLKHLVTVTAENENSNLEQGASSALARTLEDLTVAVPGRGLLKDRGAFKLSPAVVSIPTHDDDKFLQRKIEQNPLKS